MDTDVQRKTNPNKLTQSSFGIHRGLVPGHPADTKSTDAQVPYIKWHSTVGESSGSASYGERVVPVPQGKAGAPQARACAESPHESRELTRLCSVAWPTVGGKDRVDWVVFSILLQPSLWTLP